MQTFTHGKMTVEVGEKNYVPGGPCPYVALLQDGLVLLDAARVPPQYFLVPWFVNFMPKANDNRDKLDQQWPDHFVLRDAVYTAAKELSTHADASVAEAMTEVVAWFDQMSAVMRAADVKD